MTPFWRDYGEAPRSVYDIKLRPQLATRGGPGDGCTNRVENKRRRNIWRIKASSAATGEELACLRKATPHATRGRYETHRIVNIIATAFGLLLGPAPASAQASRTWVSGVGDDANPCSRTAPCKTFPGAISKTAANGEINTIDPGGFGAVTITKAITIDGGGGHTAGILASLVNGIIINAGANDIIQLRNLDINGFGNGLNGIRFLAGGALIVENVNIFGFTQNAIDFEPNATAKLVVKNSTFSRNLGANGAGILVKPLAPNFARATIEGVTVTQNDLFGLRVENGGRVSVRDSVFSHNGGNGVIAASPSGNGSVINIKRSTIANNVNGVAASGAGATIRLSEVGVFDNTSAGILSQNGSSVISFGNNRNAGNAINGAPTSTAAQQ